MAAPVLIRRPLPAWTRMAWVDRLTFKVAPGSMLKVELFWIRTLAGGETVPVIWQSVVISQSPVAGGVQVPPVLPGSTVTPVLLPSLS